MSKLEVRNKKLSDGLMVIRDDISLAIHLIDINDKEESRKSLELALSYVDELNGEYAAKRKKEVLTVLRKRPTS